MKYLVKNKNNYLKLNISCSLLVFLTVITFLSCEDFVDIDAPKDQVVTEEVFSTDETVTAAISGVYSLMTSNFDNIFNTSLEVYTGIASDEFTNHNTAISQEQYYTNELQSDNTLLYTQFWGIPYNVIANVNVIAENLENNTNVSAELRDQVLGEALFVRAFTHFYLTNLFGDIPYVDTSDVEINASISRSSQSEVYNFIIEDLLRAQNLMIDGFEYSSEQKVRPNKSAVTAFLARVYLYVEDWENAEIQATNIISQSGVYNLENNLDNVFLPDSNEVIWQLKSVFFENRTRQGDIFVLGFPPGNFLFTTSLSHSLVNAFELGDSRRSQWVGLLDFGFASWHYPFKYKNGIFNQPNAAEYSVVLRLAEQFLIRAEARAQQGDQAGAVSDLDEIRNRANLPLIQVTNPGISLPNLLLAIEQERRVELFAEFGHRWLDLKRTSRIDEVLGAIKTNWESTDAFFPIPEQEIINNPNLLPQNEGY
ncbi:RagB/SusD family nutrient uptake outer membrane protein [Flavivirga amylovorans]|uniref:RagB/SusD family nutrient uptake outer membrane protein n=1 Tax=Flavivirga amylovorans TaxID=870486 RepID=A0ABT8X0Q6_9FLAO|nr:RagB/SusD family nutrient uptake outer membrane protein [Flavivirga amylovorans]MDO5987529.1 RagB/SusD family nutrient uptake outer membrane protein [Flavivirga amylovorans]